MKLKIACVQINPKIGHVESNIKKVQQILGKLHGVDLVMLPEFAITGYNFPDRKAIEPYLEFTASGRSTQLAKEILTKFECFTMIGYPEKDKEQDYNIYNSAVLTAPNGSVLYNYRKTFLYDTDVAFGCQENPDKQFTPLRLVLDKEYYLNKQPNKEYPAVTTNFGICMDINPYQFTAPFNKFEMSLACFANKATLILCPMAWLSTKSPSISESGDKTHQSEMYEQKFFSHNNAPAYNVEAISRDNYSNHLVEQHELHDKPFVPQNPDYSTINYWILRFFPFLNHPNNQLAKYYKSVTVVACNRVGIESDVLYGGSSSIFQFSDTPGNYEVDNRNPSVVVKGSLGQGEEGVLVREIDIDV